MENIDTKKVIDFLKNQEVIIQAKTNEVNRLRRLLGESLNVENKLAETNDEKIDDMIKKAIQLFSHLDFLEGALNFYWHDANENLKRKDLGDIERQNYEKQLSKCKLIMQEMNLI